MGYYAHMPIIIGFFIIATLGIYLVVASFRNDDFLIRTDEINSLSNATTDGKIILNKDEYAKALRLRYRIDGTISILMGTYCSMSLLILNTSCTFGYISGLVLWMVNFQIFNNKVKKYLKDK